MEEIVRAPHRPLAVLAVFVIVGPLIGVAITLLPLAPFILLNGAPGGFFLLAAGYPMGAVPAAVTGVMANIAIAKWSPPAFLPICAVTGALASAAWAMINTQSTSILAWLPLAAFGVVCALSCAGIVHLLGLRGGADASAEAPPPPGPRPLNLRAGDALLIVLGVVMAVMVATLLIPALV